MPLGMQFRDKRAWWGLISFVLIAGVVVASFLLGPIWLPFVVLPLVMMLLWAFVLVNSRKQFEALGRSAPHLPEMLRNFGRPQPVGQPGQQGLKRFASLAWGHMPGQEWNYRYGQYRGEFFASFSFYASPAVSGYDSHEVFHVAYIDTRQAGPTVHIANARATLPLDLRLSQRVQTESQEFNDKWTAYSRDPRAAHAVLSPRVMHLLNDSRVAARVWVIENGAVAMVGKDQLGDHNVGPILDELRALAQALPGVAPR